MKNRHILFYSFLLLIIVLLVFLRIPNHNKIKVTIINNSGQTISFLSISLFGSEWEYSVSHLNPKGSFKVEFIAYSDSHYVLKGELQNGSKIDQELGYTTGGMDFEDTIIIEKDGNAVLKNETL